MKKYMVYGKWEETTFITWAPSPVAYSMRKEIKGRYNLKVRKELYKPIR